MLSRERFFPCLVKTGTNKTINKDKKDMDFTKEVGLSEVREACGEHWNEWSEQNRGGVSPFYKVINTKKIYFGEKRIRLPRHPQVLDY